MQTSQIPRPLTDAQPFQKVDRRAKRTSLACLTTSNEILSQKNSGFELPKRRPNWSTITPEVEAALRRERRAARDCAW